jgi:hypothetical protein
MGWWILEEVHFYDGPQEVPSFLDYDGTIPNLVVYKGTVCSSSRQAQPNELDCRLQQAIQ